MFFNLLVAAGSETTRNAIALGMAALIEHPDQWALLHADPSLLTGAVEEILRWSSPTLYNRRTATRDMEVAGQPIRAGDKVTLWWASANRDEAVFDEPFRFDVRRAPNPHLAFGYRSHFCLGANLARMEIRIMLEELLAALRGFPARRSHRTLPDEQARRGEAHAGDIPPPAAGSPGSARGFRQRIQTSRTLPGSSRTKATGRSTHVSRQLSEQNSKVAPLASRRRVEGRLFA